MSFDTIIIGAGSAGCVLANRLTERPTHRVLLLEAGGKGDQTEAKVPAAFSKMFKTPVDWTYKTVPQRHLNDRVLFWPRGKMLGGSSNLNAMIYTRGHRAVYDHWEDALGCEGWGFNRLLPYFKRAENQARGEDAYHGVDGPLDVSDLRDPHALSESFIKASVEQGLPYNPDFNGAKQTGVGLYQVTQRRGERCSTAGAYIKPALDRPNLRVETHAQVTRLLFRGKTCVGVAFRQNGRDVEVHATKEVVLCGGAINSPQLLLLSGVGPAAHLQEMGIDVVHDLPGVGENLQDHPFAGVMYSSTRANTLAGAETPWQLVKYLVAKKGMLTSNVGEAGAFLQVLDDAPWPDLQFHFAPSYYAAHGFDNPDGHGYSIGPTLVYPRSRGRLTLASPNPLAAPNLDPNYFDDEADLEVMVRGVRLARRIGESKAFAEVRGVEVAPGRGVQTNDEIRAYLRETTETLYHPVGTCKMGAESDDTAVVDPLLRVRGLDRLRVVDASVMPLLVNANTNAPTIAIAEKAADILQSNIQ